MLTYHRKPVCLSLTSVDLPFWSVVETAATLYQKDDERFHLLLTEPTLPDPLEDSATLTPEAEPIAATPLFSPPQSATQRLLWLEISPYRVIMTMQGNGRYSYRHFWERGVYGLSRYWLQDEQLDSSAQIRLRNFTRDLTLSGSTLPEHLRVEYELWANQVRLGKYVLNLEIHH